MPRRRARAVPRGAGPEGGRDAELRVFWLGFNQGLDELPGSDVRGRNPFRDRRVREAVYRAIDVGELIRDALGGWRVPAGMIVAPGVNGWSEELDRHPPYDPDGAGGCSPRPATRTASRCG